MLEAIAHGWPAFAATLAAVQAPMWVALARHRAPASRYFLAPLVAAPLTVLSGVAAGLLPGGVLQIAGAALAGAALGYAGGKSLANRATPADRHVRGAQLRAWAPPGGSDGLTLAGREIPGQDEAKHFKLIGTTGTGKSTAIHELLTRALQRGDRAVIADPDGGYAQRFYRPERGDLLLNPFDVRSGKWDLFAEIREPHDVEQLARSLIPDHEGADRSWRAYARTFFTAVTRQAHEAGVREVGELFRLLVVADNEELRTLVRGTPAQPFLEQHNGRMFDSIRSVTSAAVGVLEHVARQRATPLSVRQWTRDAPAGVLFMPYRATQIAALHSAVSSWMRLAIFETMNRDLSTSAKASRTWFVVDELDALGQIDGLKDALARLRKFDGRCVLGFQSIAQVSSTYGAGDAHTIVENCGNTLILRCSASEGGGTARFASHLIGEREVLRTQRSSSRRLTEWLGAVTLSESLALETAVLPAQIEQLPDLAGFLKYASDPNWRPVRLSVDAVRREGASLE
jgi:type IV secretory pathway TraG/TraD family ATPase VirD4